MWGSTCTAREGEEEAGVGNSPQTVGFREAHASVAVGGCGVCEVVVVTKNILVQNGTVCREGLCDWVCFSFKGNLSRLYACISTLRAERVRL